jgi:uroporphyrinogen-III decarboxylase
MFSGLIGIFGWDALLMALGEDEEKFNKVVNSYAIWSEQFFDALAKSNVPVVMVHDDLCWTSGPVTRPQWYRDNIFPHLRRFIKKLKDAGKLVYFTSDGFIEEFYGDFVDMGVDALVMEPCNDIFKFAELYGDRCGFVGGIDCRDLTYSPLPEIKAKMEKLMALGKRYPGFVLAVGNHMAGDVPAERALYYNELYEKLAVR